MSMKKSNDTIGNRTRDQPQPTALPRALNTLKADTNNNNNNNRALKFQHR